jgi:hypothetical protein
LSTTVIAVAIRKYSATIKSPQGFPIQSPYLAIATRQAEVMMRIPSEFGFPPASGTPDLGTAASAPSLFDLERSIDNRRFGQARSPSHAAAD